MIATSLKAFQTVEVWFVSVALLASAGIAAGSPPGVGASTVGRCLVVGLAGTTLDKVTRDALVKGKISGVLLLGLQIQSIGQVRRLTESIRRAAALGGRPPPIICIDQEGGRVNRLGRLPGFPFEPSARRQSKWTSAQIEERSYEGARYMRSLGINVNLAPDLDLSDGTGVIGDRSFGPDPEGVVRCASATFAGAHRAGLAEVLKHFPGHGLTSQDSHRVLPIIYRDSNTIELHESVFARMMKSNPDGVMLGHLMAPNIDSRYPASLSGTFARKLRSLIGSRRLIFTDDGAMRSLASYGSEADRAARAIDAGCDIYLTTSTTQQLGSNFDRKVERKIQFRKMILAASDRVTAWRKNLGGVRFRGNRLTRSWPLMRIKG